MQELVFRIAMELVVVLAVVAKAVALAAMGVVRAIVRVHALLIVGDPVLELANNKVYEVNNSIITSLL